MSDRLAAAAETGAGGGAAPQVWTVRRVLEWTVERIARSGAASARLDADLLLAETLGVPRLALYTDRDKPLAAAELERFRDLVRRRIVGEPVAYLLGRREFWSMELAVDARVLVPRPDTEAVVQEALALLAGVERPRFVDVGCGSGAIALAIARERPDAEAVATDASADALAVAAGNAARLGIAVTVAQGDLLDAATGDFTLIVSNPPYLTPDEVTREIAAEPRDALVSGPSGLEVTARLVAAAPARLREGGALVVETASARAASVVALFDATGAFQAPRVARDLGGLPRVVSARRK